MKISGISEAKVIPRRRTRSGVWVSVFPDDEIHRVTRVEKSHQLDLIGRCTANGRPALAERRISTRGSVLCQY